MENLEIYSLCPFFMGEDKNEITCRGINAELVQRFASINSRKAYSRCYCYKLNHNRCTLCKAQREQIKEYEEV